MRYNAPTRQRFENPTAAGAATGDGWYRGQAGSREAGAWVQFDVFAPDKGSIRSVRFLAFGCPHVIAVAQWLAEKAPEVAVDEARLPESIQALRARFEIPVEKLGRLLVIEDAWVAALQGARERPPGLDDGG